MNLVDAICDFAKPLLQTTDWYHWKIPDRKLPAGISLEPGTSHQRNIDLKDALHANWLKADKEKRYELASFYVRDWGGIRANSAEKLRRYAAASADELIGNGYDGVATWSKVLCIHDPDRYAIFDARVSVALNALQVIHRVPSPLLFKPLESQNKAITSANERLVARAAKEHWQAASSESYYGDYLRLLEPAGATSKTRLCVIEMLLFAHAEELSAAIN